jgi:hypothetical protein
MSAIPNNNSGQPQDNKHASVSACQNSEGLHGIQDTESKAAQEQYLP